MEQDETATSEVKSPSCEASLKTPRYLEKMEVRIKDSSQSHAGCEGFVTCIIPPDACLIQVCEPFIFRVAHDLPVKPNVA